MSKKSDFDNKLKQLSRKTDVEIFKQNMGFEAEIKKLDKKTNSYDEFSNIKNRIKFNYIEIIVFECDWNDFRNS